VPRRRSKIGHEEGYHHAIIVLFIKSLLIQKDSLIFTKKYVGKKLKAKKERHIVCSWTIKFSTVKKGESF
jgi:hypothetical protein